MKVCWNAIVRNEAARIERCMESLIHHVDCAVILDTGSEDNTHGIIREFFARHDKPVEIHHSTFVNFELARNEALELARASALEFDYLLLLDADMELRGTIPELTAPAAMVLQKAGSLEYMNTRLLSRNAKARYVGVTHEYLDVPEGVAQVPGDRLYCIDHWDGANRKDKFKRDIELLTKALETDPTNARYTFYLAQSYRDAGDPHGALAYYLKRVALGGWDEEVWNAQLNVAHCMLTMGDEEGFVANILKAHEMRPQRAEAVYDLAKHYREQGRNNLAALFAREAQGIPRPRDVLFVNDYVYAVGADEEMSIAGFYNPSTRAEGFRACNHVALGAHGYGIATQQARGNLFHYLPRAAEIMPSFTAAEIGFHTEDGWKALNPSVARKGDDLYCVVRTVNYVITPDGRYDIDGKSGAITEDNPIRTRNFLLKLDNGLAQIWAREIDTPKADAFKLVRGWEDMRLFAHHGSLVVSATVREANEGGVCEQWYGTLAMYTDPGLAGRCMLGGAKHLPNLQDHEKNWMPVINRGPQKHWLYQLGTVIDEDKRLGVRRCYVDPTNLRGSSQVIPFKGNRLCIVHEASVGPSGKRFYWHRWVLLDNDLNVSKVSLPFVFHDKQIEFCAGLCWHPDDQRLVISYGVRDSAAWVATVNANDVMRAVFHEG